MNEVKQIYEKSRRLDKSSFKRYERIARIPVILTMTTTHLHLDSAWGFSHILPHA